MEHTIAEEYKSSLNDLNFNSKPLINMLTMLADENKKHATLIVTTIVNHILSITSESKLPGLYLVDSIMKNVGDPYQKMFCHQVINLFTSVFEKVDENTRSLMFKLRQTWNDIIPNKILYNLDTAVESIDPAWPVTAKNPMKTILVNPKFLDEAAEEKCNSGVSFVKNEEEKIKQKQTEALKELLAKQEQLRQLEIKKLQQTMKKRVPVSDRDPRMIKTTKKIQHVTLRKELTVHKKITSTVEINSCTSNNNMESSISQCMKSSETPKIENNKNIPLAIKSTCNKSNLSQSNSQVTDIQLSSQRRDLEKNKCNNRNIKKNESNPLPHDCFKSEIVSNKVRTGNLKKHCENNDRSKTSKEDRMPKIKSVTPREKNSAPATCHKSSNSKVNIETSNKNDNQVKMPKKNESSLNSNTLIKTENKVHIKEENKSIKKFEKIIKKKEQNISNEHIETFNLDKSNDCCKNTLQSFCVDEERKNKHVSLNENITFKVPKCEKEDLNKINQTLESTEPPKKKIKSEDSENLNPDRKIESPVLFGNEDQDLRQSTEKTFVIEKVKKTQSNHELPYKQENISDSMQQNYVSVDVNQGCTPVPIKQENIDRICRSEKQLSDSFDRQSSSRYCPRKFNTRYARRRINTFRYRGKPLNKPDIGQVMLNPSGFMEQAFEKYHSGKISEKECETICFGLQKMLKSPEYQCFKNSIPKIQNIKNCEENSESHKEENYKSTEFFFDNFKIQGPSVFLPPCKHFMLGGRKRMVYFIGNKAIANMNNELRELYFKNDPKLVYIEGLTKPITLGFDGKSMEFEIDGRRHIIRFGIPGREIFINNHPYEACFGGHPIAAMLEDGCVYKIRLSGPPPQVLIGNKVEDDLIDRYIGNNKKTPFKILSDSNKNYKLETPNSIPELQGPLQDVDMRIKPENLQQPDTLVYRNSPFYSEAKDGVTDMKDVDWRKIPPTNIIEKEKKIHEREIFEYKHSASWLKASKEKVQSHPYEDRFCQPLKHSQEYEWNTTAEPLTSVTKLHVDGHATSLYDTWHLKDENKYTWRNKEHSQKDFSGHSQYSEIYQVQNNLVQHFPSEQIEYQAFNRNRSFSSHFRRPIFHHRHMRGCIRGPSYQPWLSQNSTCPPRLQNFSSTTVCALSPASPSYSDSISSNVLPLENNTKAGQTDNLVGSLPDHLKHSPVELPQSDHPAFDMKVDVESLLEKLIAAGIIPSKTEEETIETNIAEPVDINMKTRNDTPDDVIIDLSVESLKLYHKIVPTELHKGFQCASCGMRFKEMESEHYSRHLDWHFRMNRREKDGVKKAFSRCWYLEIEEWIQFEEFEDFGERVPSYFELEADNEQIDGIDSPIIISTPASTNDEECCAMCHERFQLFWIEEEEEWHLRNAVRHEDDVYHPACYEDFVKLLEAQKSVVSETISTDIRSSEAFSADESDEIFSLLDELLNNVCNKISLMLEVPNNEISPDYSIKSEVPSVKMDLDEDIILEGKPGEEEIIGVITDSDVESEINAPNVETKMVVLQSGGITLKVKAESLHSHPFSNRSSCDKSLCTNSEKETKSIQNKTSFNNNNEDDEYEENFRPPTPDPKFKNMTPVSKGKELSGLCCIM